MLINFLVMFALSCSMSFAQQEATPVPMGSGEIESEHPQVEKKPSQPKAAKKAFFENPTQRRHFLAVMIGPAYLSVGSPNSEFGIKNGVSATFHADQHTHIFFVQVPWVSGGINLNYLGYEGLAGYHYKSDGGISFSGNFPFRAHNLDAEFLLRFRPLAGARIQPYGEAGVGLGWTRVQFDGSTQAKLDPQGPNAPTREDLVNFDYALSAGLEWDFASIFGVGLSYRRGNLVTSKSKLLDSYIALHTDEVRLDSYLRF